MLSNLVLSAFGFTAVTSNSWSLSDQESCEYCAGSVWFTGISRHPFPCWEHMGCVLAGFGLCSLCSLSDTLPLVVYMSVAA